MQEIVQSQIAPLSEHAVEAFEIFNWYGDRKVNTVLAQLGYHHRQIVTGDIFEVAKKFHEANISVMIRKLNNANSVLGLDTMSFGSR